MPPLPGTYCMGFRGSMQLDHVALQVLLLHELLGAGGTLEKQAPSAQQPVPSVPCHQFTAAKEGLTQVQDSP